MVVVVIGAGRMGIRHCLGVLAVDNVSKLIVVDINSESLSNAKLQLASKTGKVEAEYYLLEDFLNREEEVDVVILASTAGDRLEVCKRIIKFKPKYFLIEKPLGQSLLQVNELVKYFESQKAVKAFVNLNTRLYAPYQKLKEDLKTLTQFRGLLTFSINTGTVGIGANGIHYVDLIKFLTSAETIHLVNASIDEVVIPSGRGKEFADFGGYSILDFMDKQEKKLARAYLILGSQSTALGPWEIVGSNGRILIDEFEQKRYNKYRNPESTLPVQRYAGDYLPIEEEPFEIPFLNTLTEKWLRELSKGEYILPELRETIEVHKTIFDWLNYSGSYNNVFPIT